MSFFTITIVGKPNVGKSTLFNLLSKKNLAIVDDTPGVTVDYKENIISFYDLQIKVIDTGGITSNKQKNKKFNKTIISEAINVQSRIATELADLILFIVDAKEDLTYEDIEIANSLRKNNKNVILIINKVDNKANEINIPEITTLGFKHIVKMSTMHKLGLQELYKSIKPFYTKYKDIHSNAFKSSQDVAPFLSISIVGKPNTGKSTLINSLLKDKRLAVSNIPGTTKDSISVYFNYKNKIIRVTDTAGLIRKSKIKQGVDTLAKNETIRSIIFAHIVILVIDATVGITKQDLTLASYILKEGRAIIIILNKIDLISNLQELKKEIILSLNESFSNVKGIKIITTSGLNSINLNSIFKESLLAYSKWCTTIKTSLLNRWLNSILISNPPPLHNGKLLKIKFISQEKTRPPTFNLWVNLKTGIPTSYLNFLRNKLYKTFDLWGIPLRLNVKINKNPYIK